MSPGSARPPGDVRGQGITVYCEVCRHAVPRTRIPHRCPCRDHGPCTGFGAKVREYRDGDRLA
ncbi:hypothetical protein ACIBG8_47285 [Nonomuraea sp. NPDC050556]|uniref:hypothetical protein n=1 Tax=Nonomuraea sp. NPDC050556 TaxID=3364369 RepID=UPI0037A5E5D5